jgi:methyl-accepting chemotaxis protein
MAVDDANRGHVRTLSLLSLPVRQVGITLKILLVAIVLTVPLAMSVREQRGEVSSDVAFTTREIDGLAQIDRVLLVIAEIRGARRAAKDEISFDGTTLDTALVAWTEGFTTGGTPVDPALADRTMATVASATTVDRLWELDELLEGFATELIAASDASNLTLDPELSSYYLGATLTATLPSLLDQLDRVSLTTERRAAEPSNEQLRDELLIELAVGASLLDTMTSSLTSALATVRVDVADALTTDIETFTAASTTTIEQGKSSMTDPAVVADRLDVTMLSSLQRSLLVQLEAELTDRVTELESTNRSRLVVLSLFCLVALALVALIAVSTTQSARSIRRTLGDLAAGRLRRSRPLGGRDEFARMERDLGTAMDQTRDSIVSISSSAGSLQRSAADVGSLSAALSDRATRTTHEASQVTSATAQLASAIDEIANAATHASEVAATARDTSREATVAIGELEHRSAEIGDVVASISDIAELTNLLALNATIEAARAGVAGRGFAVVANEVKSLAAQTARATETISTVIGQVQADTQRAVDAITRISVVIDEVNVSQTTIASAVEQQAAATGQISSIVASFATAASETGEGADALASVASELGRSSESLLMLVEHYER